ncbi:M20 metallopeptidase family protein [Rubinisphaera italica]|uniref:Putative hydrolase YxeP n=1 Tax=Rubinisphaera italica TaxID=2527969 RepID=A0A5C5XCF5_9PLAN|nr:M20 family metallopeptidase [Rubinisphaera italica]TWT60726.1 putative hydrolase YxeP [Rubinisphaera italica]
MSDLLPAELFQKLIEVRRDLHRNPEPSWQEFRTAEKVCQFLDEHRISYRDGIAGTGILAEIPGANTERFIAIRGDMDALPVHEETGLEFASRIEGMMHACGHDGHTTMVLGAAALLRAAELPVSVRFIFQPAEETGLGAKKMIEENALDGVSMIFGGHVDRHYHAGSIAISDGPVNASSDQFKISIFGGGGHAARPHEAVDPVVVGSLLVMALQTIVSREVDPAHPSVVTVGDFHAGTAPNVLASCAVLRGTIRAQDAAVRKHLKASIRRIAESVARLHNTEIDVELCEGTPPVINSDEMIQLARQAAISVVGENNTVKMRAANMGGEDFGFYLQKVPGCYVRFGSVVPGKEGYPAHSSRFDFDEKALAVGATYFAEIARIAAEQIHNTSSQP